MSIYSVLLVQLFRALKMKKIAFIIFSIIGLSSYAQMALNPVSWSAQYVDLKNGEGEIIYTATIEPHWHIYSQTINGEGPIPTTFSVVTTKNFKLNGKVLESGSHEIYDKSFDIKLNVFDNKAVFTQKIKRVNKKSFKIKTSVEYMSCNDTQCLPPKTVELEITLPNSK